MVTTTCGNSTMLEGLHVVFRVHRSYFEPKVSLLERKQTYLNITCCPTIGWIIVNWDAPDSLVDWSSFWIVTLHRARNFPWGRKSPKTNFSMLPIGRASESLILQVLYSTLLLGLSTATLKVLLLNPTTSIDTYTRFFVDRGLLSLKLFISFSSWKLRSLPLTVLLEI